MNDNDLYETDRIYRELYGILLDHAAKHKLSMKKWHELFPKFCAFIRYYVDLPTLDYSS